MASVFLVVIICRRRIVFPYKRLIWREKLRFALANVAFFFMQQTTMFLTDFFVVARRWHFGWPVEGYLSWASFMFIFVVHTTKCAASIKIWQSGLLLYASGCNIITYSSLLEFLNHVHVIVHENN